MNSAQLLVPPPNGQDSRSDLQKELWEKSHLRIGKILPGFLEDFVAQSAQSEPVVPTSAVPSAVSSSGQAEKEEVQEKPESDQATATVEK